MMTTKSSVHDEIAAHHLKVRQVPIEVNPADLATKYLFAPRMHALLVLLGLKLVEADDNADARFWDSEQVSGWKLKHGLALLVTMTVFLCVAGWRRCKSQAAQPEQHGEENPAPRTAATHPAVSAVVHMRTHSMIPHAARELKSEDSIETEQSQALSWT